MSSKPNRAKSVSGIAPASAADSMFGDSAGDNTTSDEQASSAVAQPRTESIAASALTAGIDCPFTDGCRGKVVVFHRGTMPNPDKESKTETVRFQQLKCSKCNAIADGVKVLGVAAPGSPRLFNRETAQVE